MRLSGQSGSPATRGHYKRWWPGADSYHVRNVVRVHLIQILVVDVGVGEVEAADRRLEAPLRAKLQERGGDRAGAHPSTRSPMLSKWPRKVRQWYC